MIQIISDLKEATKGKTQMETSIALGCQLATLNRWFNDHFEPSSIYQEKIREYIDKIKSNEILTIPK